MTVLRHENLQEITSDSIALYRFNLCLQILYWFNCLCIYSLILTAHKRLEYKQDEQPRRSNSPGGRYCKDSPTSAPLITVLLMCSSLAVKAQFMNAVAGQFGNLEQVSPPPPPPHISKVIYSVRSNGSECRNFLPPILP